MLHILNLFFALTKIKAKAPFNKGISKNIYTYEFLTFYKTTTTTSMACFILFY